jgi:hypothetical protein
MNIAEGGRFINASQDYSVRFPCGCAVVFLGSCFHRSSRMDCCERHRRATTEERTAIVLDARQQLAIDKMNQPPR